MKKSICIALGPAAIDRPDYSVLKVTHLIRKMMGRSQSILALCDDNLYYVLKFSGNPKGPDSLAKELLGLRLADAIGLSVPRFAPVYVSRDLIMGAPADWFENYHSGPRPSHGLHFATRFVGNPHGVATSDHISERSLQTVENLREFLPMLMLDIWANRQIPRKAIFERQPGGKLRARFVGFEAMFGPSEEPDANVPAKAFYFDSIVYKGLWNEVTIEAWANMIRKKTAKLLAEEYKGEVPEWFRLQSRSVHADLKRRLWTLDLLFYRGTQHLRH